MFSSKASPARNALESFAAAAYLFVLFLILLGCALFVGAEAAFRLARETKDIPDEE